MAAQLASNELNWPKGVCSRLRSQAYCLIHGINMFNSCKHDCHTSPNFEATWNPDHVMVT